MAFDPRQLGESVREQAERVENAPRSDPGKQAGIDSAKACQANFVKQGREQARKDFLDDVDGAGLIKYPITYWWYCLLLPGFNGTADRIKRMWGTRTEKQAQLLWARDDAYRELLFRSVDADMARDVANALFNAADIGP